MAQNPEGQLIPSDLSIEVREDPSRSQKRIDIRLNIAFSQSVDEMSLKMTQDPNAYLGQICRHLAETFVHKFYGNLTHSILVAEREMMKNLGAGGLYGTARMDTPANAIKQHKDELVNGILRGVLDSMTGKNAGAPTQQQVYLPPPLFPNKQTRSIIDSLSFQPLDNSFFDDKTRAKFVVRDGSPPKAASSRERDYVKAGYYVVITRDEKGGHTQKKYYLPDLSGAKQVRLIRKSDRLMEEPYTMELSRPVISLIGNDGQARLAEMAQNLVNENNTLRVTVCSYQQMVSLYKRIIFFCQRYPSNGVFTDQFLEEMASVLQEKYQYDARPL